MKKIINVCVFLCSILNYSYAQNNPFSGFWKEDGGDSYWVITDDTIYIGTHSYSEGGEIPLAYFIDLMILLDKNTIQFKHNDTILYKVNNENTKNINIIGCFISINNKTIIFNDDNTCIIEDDSIKRKKLEGEYSLYDNKIIIKVNNDIYSFYIINDGKNRFIMCTLGPDRYRYKLFYYLGEDFYILIQ
jgi:hypothetical protein